MHGKDGWTLVEFDRFEETLKVNRAVHVVARGRFVYERHNPILGLETREEVKRLGSYRRR